MKTQSLKRSAILLTLASGVLMARTAPAMGAPGAVNYIEGNVSIDGAPLNSQQIGSTALRANQAIATADGKAEVLLSPGAFLRLGSNSEVRMISPALVDPRVEVVHGSALIEVDSKLKEAHLDIVEHGATASVLKEGLYRFDADQSKIGVIDGKLLVASNDQSKEIGKGKEIVLDNAPKLKAVSFDRHTKDELYVWSDIRSNYLAEANASTARYISSGYGPYSGAGWYWNPYFSMYSWLPGDGFFYSPFGYPFYSLGYAPFYGGYYGSPRYFRRPLTGSAPIHGIRPGFRSTVAPRASGFAGAGGFRGGVSHGFAAGGFHGGGRR